MNDRTSGSLLWVFCKGLFWLGILLDFWMICDSDLYDFFPWGIEIF